ncbi:MAG: hypothetical protein B7Y80_19075 [Hyphomicrobium sp. 32-62-53]|nr:MAG: hypothetical protein B7Y80_19075 [Hyphomicrobium sp. 32-62-53]
MQEILVPVDHAQASDPQLLFRLIEVVTSGESKQSASASASQSPGAAHKVTITAIEVFWGAELER